MSQLLLAILIVLLASALCSGIEAAFFSVPIIRVRRLAQSQKPAAIALLAIQENISRPIATIVILNNIANIVGSIEVGNIAIHVLGSQWLGLFSGALTFLVIIFSEIIPKTLGERYAAPISLLAARPVLALTLLFTPLVWLIEKLISPLTQGQNSPITDEAEIALLATVGRSEGIIEDDESEMILRVFKLNDVTAADLMTPRVTITYLTGNDSLADAQEQIINSQHSRMVVIGESVDDVIGMALKSELLQAVVQGRQDEPIRTFVHEIQFVPQSARSDKLLRTFQRARQHLAVVLDEYGGVAGLITLEDVLEVLTGEIVDETDRSVDMRETARRRRPRLPGMHN